MLGIIGAMKAEVEQLKQEMKQPEVVTVAGMEFYKGTIGEKEVVVVQSGIGKVSAALCVQILCDCFGVTHLVNTGIAGSLCAQLDIGDLVVSRDAMYHDFDCVHFGYPFGKVPGMDVIAFPADDTMLGCAFAAAEAGLPCSIRLFARTAACSNVGFSSAVEAVGVSPSKISTYSPLGGFWVLYSTASERVPRHEHSWILVSSFTMTIFLSPKTDCISLRVFSSLCGAS